MLTGQKIAVIGGGVGGLAAALACNSRNADVTVYEQAAALTEIGAGLQISPNGLAVLDALGAGQALRECSPHARAVELRDYRRGDLVLRLDLARNAPDLDFLLVHRADLIEALANRSEQTGLTVALDHQLSSVSSDGSKTTLNFSGRQSALADLVVGADGARSVIRPLVDGPSNPFFTGQAAWRAIVPCAKAEPVVRVFMGPGRHLVCYPLRDRTQMNIVAVEERKEWVAESWSQQGNPDDLRAAFLAFGGPVPALLEAVETCAFWGLHRTPVATQWHKGPMAILGDAAHPTLPFLAQGANLALEDAWVLSDCLDHAEGGLSAYQARRQARARRVIEAANKNARNYHLRNPLIRGLGHTMLRAANASAGPRAVKAFDWLYRFDVTKGA